MSGNSFTNFTLRPVENFEPILSFLRPERHIFLPYDDQFHWLLVTECALRSTETATNTTVHVITYPTPARILDFCRKLIGYKRISPELVREMLKHGVKIKKKLILNPKFLSRITINQDADGFFSPLSEIEKLIYPHLVDSVRSRKIKVEPNFKLIQKLARSSRVAEYYCAKVSVSKESEKYVPNGRYAMDKTVRDFYQNLGEPIFTLETGPSGFAIRRDAQSIKENEYFSLRDWEQSDKQKRTAAAHDFIEKRELRKAGKEPEWTKGMKLDSIPSFEPGKKILVFYPTSQIEFVGNGDKIPIGNFQNQAEALQALIDICDPEEWQIFVRMHPPRNDGSPADDEEDIWNFVNDFNHVVRIAPESDIDSYALAEKSDLVAHFGSTIGMELIYKGNIPVIAMSFTGYDSQSPETHIYNRNSLINYLRNTPFAKARPESVMPWAHFLATFGEKFKFFQHSPVSDWCINDTPIYMPINEWVEVSKGRRILHKLWQILKTKRRI